MARMLGRLGWRGQCACCNGPRGKQEIKREEERAWRRELDDPPEYNGRNGLITTGG